jgi:hypothetical protein
LNCFDNSLEGLITFQTTLDRIRELQTKHIYKRTVAERETTALQKNLEFPNAGTRLNINWTTATGLSRVHQLKGVHELPAQRQNKQLHLGE